MLGLKRGEVRLADHNPEWGMLAVQMTEWLKSIFGAKAIDIQHVGSTSIKGIKAKPIIDIAVGVIGFDCLDDVFVLLDENGLVKSAAQPILGDILCAFKDKSVNEKYVVHIELFGGEQWHNHTDFRDYLNAFPKKANAYEELKIGLAKQYPNDRNAYLNGKRSFIEKTLIEARIYMELRESLDITAFEPINKGWSGDKKYSVEIADGRHMLLRVSGISELDRKKAEYEMMKRVADFGIPAPQPVLFGICDNGRNVYQLFTWIEGEDAEAALPLMTETEQYVLGIKAGKILRKIHSIPIPETQSDWRSQYFDYINGRLAALKTAILILTVMNSFSIISPGTARYWKIVRGAFATAIIVLGISSLPRIMSPR